MLKLINTLVFVLTLFIVTHTFGQVNHAPSAVRLFNPTVKENLPINAYVSWFVTTDRDAKDHHTCHIVGDDYDGLFEIININYVSLLKVTRPLNFEEQDSYLIDVESIDESGASVISPIMIFVADVNEAPYDLELTNATLDTFKRPRTKIGQLLIKDEDHNDEWEVISECNVHVLVNPGDFLNEVPLFYIEKDQEDGKFYLYNRTFVEAGVYELSVRVIDQGGEFKDKDFEITVFAPRNRAQNANINLDLELESTALYPNPVKNTLHISTREWDSIDIYNASGQLILKQKNNDISSIDTSYLQAGLYVAVLSKAGKSIRRKIIKK